MSEPGTEDAALQEDGAASATFYATIPQPVVAQQLVNENSTFSICTLYSMTVTYDLSGGSKTVLARVGTPTQSYQMNTGDWIVMGPNIEGVYTDQMFKAVFAPATTEIAPYISPELGDPMTAQLSIFSSVATTCSVDWGDGTVDSGIAAPVGTSPVTVTHTYDTEMRYTITVTTPDAATVKCYYVAIAPAQSENYNSGGDIVPPSAGDATDVPVTQVHLRTLAVQRGSDDTTIDDGTMQPLYTTSEMLAAMFAPETNQIPVDPSGFGEWTPEQLARLEAGEPPYIDTPSEVT